MKEAKEAGPESQEGTSWREWPSSGEHERSVRALLDGESSSGGATDTEGRIGEHREGAAGTDRASEKLATPRGKLLRWAGDRTSLEPV